MENAQIVAEHYNQRPDVGIQGRKNSPIYHMKNFNNWIKSILIGEYTHAGCTVFDIACGKGGDLMKWNKARIKELIGIDIAQTSVQQAKKRYEESRCPFNASFYAMDCFNVIQTYIYILIFRNHCLY